jgi:DNA-binding transcriptional MerR regulator
MDEMLVTSGKFARYCSTTKDTLRHYHKLGLLSPAHSEPNGYQYYNLLQVNDFSLISGLREAGYSLTKIKEYLNMPSGDELHKVFIEQIKRLKEQKRKLDRSIRMLSDADEYLQAVLRLPQGRGFSVTDKDETYFIETGISQVADADELMDTLMRTHFAYCRELGLPPAANTMRLRGAHFMAGDYFEGLSLLYEVPKSAVRRIAPERLYTRPAGRYLSFLRHIRSDEESDEVSEESSEAIKDELGADFEEFKTYARENGYKITGDVYENELAAYVGTLKDDMAYLLEARVES